MKKKFKKTVLEKNFEEDEEKEKIVFSKKIFSKEYRGLLVGIVFFIFLVGTISFFALYGQNPLAAEDPEELFYAKLVSEEMNDYFDAVIFEMTLEDGVDELDRAYIESVKEDYEWLKRKNGEIIRIGNNTLLRVMVFAYFSEIIDEINWDFSMDIGEPTKETFELTINMAKEMDYRKLELFFEEELEEFNETEKRIIKEMIDSLGREYYEIKEEHLDKSSIERQYAEAKKIIFLFGEY